MKLNHVRFLTTVCGPNLFEGFRQASKPDPRVVFLHDVQRFDIQNLGSRNVYFWIDFHEIGSCFDVVNVQYGCFLLCCVAERAS